MPWDRRNQAYYSGEEDRGRYGNEGYDDQYRSQDNFQGRDLRADRSSREHFHDIRDSQQNDFDGNIRSGYESHGYRHDPDDNYLHPPSPERHERYSGDGNRNADYRRSDNYENSRMDTDHRYPSNSQQEHRYSGDRIEMRNMNLENQFNVARHENQSPHQFHDTAIHIGIDVHHPHDYDAKDGYYEELEGADHRGRSFRADHLRARSEPRGQQYNDFSEPERDHAWQERSDDRRRPYQSQPELVGGHQNMGFEGDLEIENSHNYRPKVHRGVSLRRRSRKSRRERRSEVQTQPRISLADGMKTIIQRRKTLRIQRPMSELYSSRMSRAGSVFFGNAGDESEDEDERLPSNRNAKRKTLKYRLESLQRERPVSSHDMATLLR